MAIKAGIYISIPYCRQKCTYCNFASAARPIAELPHYLSALEWEIARHSAIWRQVGVSAHDPLEVDSIYLGGGTPGLLGSAQMARLLGVVRDAFAISPDAEITIEASPENITANTASQWAACGVNRVSLGVQSMSTPELRAVGRMHDAATVSTAIGLLRQARIENISIDLIAGLPHQNESSWEQTLQAVLGLKVPHVSIYMLEVDEDSRLGGEVLQGGVRYGAAAVPDEQTIVELYGHAIERLRDAGLDHYEISNFALSGRQSRHNEKYWLRIPYYGFGVDAHSFDGTHRWANVDSLPDYLSRAGDGHSPILDVRPLSAQEHLEETLFLGLRRIDGVSSPMLRSQFGNDAWDALRQKTADFQELGWLELNEERLRLTERGVLFSNEVFAGLLS